MQAIPKNVSFQRGALHYKASYTRKANTLNVRRELLVQRAQRFCMPSDEKYWFALTEVMKQDLRGQIFFTFSYLRELLLIEHQQALAFAPAFADRS
jgi:hypothetical protein